MQRVHADPGIKHFCPFDIPGIGFIAADQFNQRQHVNRVKWMGHDETFGVLHLGLQLARHDAGCGGGDDRIGPGAGFNFFIYGTLDIGSFRNRFYDQLGISRCISGRVVPGNIALCRTWCRGQFCEGAFGICQYCIKFFSGIRGWIININIDAISDEASRPTTADNAPTNDGSCIRFKHVKLLLI